MPAPHHYSRLNLPRLKDLLTYDAPGGFFQWNVTRSYRAIQNEEAGHTRNHRGKRIKVITVDGRTYMANRLAWFYVMGTFPEGRLIAKDGDLSNIKWPNILLENEHTLVSGRAAYQRRYRELKRAEATGDSAEIRRAIEHQDLRDPHDPRNEEIYEPPQRLNSRGRAYLSRAAETKALAELQAKRERKS